MHPFFVNGYASEIAIPLAAVSFRVVIAKWRVRCHRRPQVYQLDVRPLGVNIGLTTINLMRSLVLVQSRLGYFEGDWSSSEL
jgi:hypothetical protein